MSDPWNCTPSTVNADRVVDWFDLFGKLAAAVRAAVVPEAAVARWEVED